MKNCEVQSSPTSSEETLDLGFGDVASLNNDMEANEVSFSALKQQETIINDTESLDSAKKPFSGENSQNTMADPGEEIPCLPLKKRKVRKCTQDSEVDGSSHVKVVSIAESTQVDTGDDSIELCHAQHQKENTVEIGAEQSATELIECKKLHKPVREHKNNVLRAIKSAEQIALSQFPERRVPEVSHLAPDFIFVNVPGYLPGFLLAMSYLDVAGSQHFMNYSHEDRRRVLCNLSCENLHNVDSVQLHILNLLKTSTSTEASKEDKIYDKGCYRVTRVSNKQNLKELMKLPIHFREQVIMEIGRSTKKNIEAEMDSTLRDSISFCIYGEGNF